MAAMSWLGRWQTSVSQPITKHEGTSATQGPQPLGSRRWLLPFALLVGSLVLLFGPILLQHMRHSAMPMVFNDDARQQIYPFLRFYDPQLFPDDLAARYYLDAYPLGYRLLYTGLAYIVDPVAVSKVVPYLLFAVLLIAVGRASFRLGGWLACWFTLIFSLSSPYFLARLAGGLPRSFGLALLACAIVVLVYGHMRGLALCTVLSAGFYAPGAVLCGITLALILLILPARDRGNAIHWSLTRRWTTVVVTAVLCVAVLLPTMLNTRKYGRILQPRDVAAYPEVGPGGRYGPDDRAPFDILPIAVFKMLPEAFRGKGLNWAPGAYDWVATFPSDIGRVAGLQWLFLALAALLCVGLVLTARARAEVRRLLAFLLTICVAYIIATPVAPYLYLPQRYTAYTIPVLATILLPFAAQSLASVLGVIGRRYWGKQAMMLLVCGACYLITGGLGNNVAGLGSVHPLDIPLYKDVAKLPPDARLAAWPSAEIASNIPYLSHREVLINYEIHQAFHKGYTDEMRRRMRALIDSYFATDPTPLIRLRDDFGVRYLIVDERDFTVRTPTYFRPFNMWIDAARSKLPHDLKQIEVFRQAKHATVIHDGPYFVLDLQQISSS